MLVIYCFPYHINTHLISENEKFYGNVGDKYFPL